MLKPSQPVLFRTGTDFDQPNAWLLDGASNLFSIKPIPEGMDETQVMDALYEAIDRDLLKKMFDSVHDLVIDVDFEDLWTFFKQKMVQTDDVTYAKVVEEFVLPRSSVEENGAEPACKNIDSPRTSRYRRWKTPAQTSDAKISMSPKPRTPDRASSTYFT